MDDARSTASSNNDDKAWNGSLPLDLPFAPPPPLPRQPPPSVDHDGFSVPPRDGDEEKANWSCSSSDEDEENEMQKSLIRGLQIRPADSAKLMNASVDELRDAIGNIQIAKSMERSSTFDRDPRASKTMTPFSQSLGGGSLKPLRPSYTGDEHLRRKATDGGMPFSMSLTGGTMGGTARPRPRSNTPTLGLAPYGHNSLCRKESGESDSGVAWPRSESVSSLGDASFTPSSSAFALSTSTVNLVQATIAEQRVPIAMALNEYAHAWFRGADTSNRTLRIFGTALVSFAVSSLPLLTDVKADIEPLRFQLVNADVIKAVLPNKQLLLPPSVKAPASSYSFTFDRLGLANWLLQQQKETPGVTFYNAEVLRYELNETVKEPPLLFCAYWKIEDGQTDIRVDYRLNTASSIQSALLNVVFELTLQVEVNSVVAEPQADLNAAEKKLSWSLTELSRHGENSGSLKARIMHSPGSKNIPGHTTAQFQADDNTDARPGKRRRGAKPRAYKS